MVKMDISKYKQHLDRLDDFKKFDDNHVDAGHLMEAVEIAEVFGNLVKNAWEKANQDNSQIEQLCNELKKKDYRYQELLKETDSQRNRTGALQRDALAGKAFFKTVQNDLDNKGVLGRPKRLRKFVDAYLTSVLDMNTKDTVGRG